MTSRKAHQILLGSVLVTLTLYVVPYGRYVAYPLVLLSTYAHEMGHGLTALVVGGSFESFQMAPDGSGLARLGLPDSRFARAATSAGGLLGPAVLAFLFFVLARRPRWARAALVSFGVASVLALPLVVRGWFGWGFVAVLGIGCTWIGTKAAPKVAQWVLVFMAVQLSLSVFSRSDYLFTESAGAAPSDVAQMASALFLPYWLWGVLVGAISVLVLVSGARMFLGRGVTAS